MSVKRDFAQPAYSAGPSGSLARLERTHDLSRLAGGVVRAGGCDNLERETAPRRRGDDDALHLLRLRADEGVDHCRAGGETRDAGAGGPEVREAPGEVARQALDQGRERALDRGVLADEHEATMVGALDHGARGAHRAGLPAVRVGDAEGAIARRIGPRARVRTR